MQQSAQYDPNSRLTNLSTTGASGLSPSSYRYGYNAADWTTSATGISGTDTLTHDAQGHLTAESGPSVLASLPGQTYRWSYDGNGNILTGMDDFGSVYTNTYSLSSPNQLAQSFDPSSHSNPTNTTYFAYDRHGDTTAITTSGALTSSEAISTGITYDAQERPLTLTHKDASYSSNAGAVVDTISAQYNATGLRSHYTVVVSGTAILDQRFSYRAGGEVGQVAAMTATLNGNGTIKSSGSYTDTFIYTQDGEPLEFVRQQHGQTNRYWYVLDGRNNVVAVTDASGAVVDRYAYDQWGEMLPGLTMQQVPQQLRYGSYWQDDALGWYWATTRYYDPEVMRWMQPDSSELDGVRTYVYVGDDPIDLTDPLGLLTCSGSHDVLSWLGDVACNAGSSAGTWWNQHTEPVYAPASEADLARLEAEARAAGTGSHLSDITAVNVALFTAGGGVAGRVVEIGLVFVGKKLVQAVARIGAGRVVQLVSRGQQLVRAGEEIQLGGGRTFSHFTNAQGAAGITKADVTVLKPGQGFVVKELQFGHGSNPMFAQAPGDIFVTEIGPEASGGELARIGVFGDKQNFAIQFSEETAFNQGVRVSGANVERSIYTIPGGTTLRGRFVVIRRG